MSSAKRKRWLHGTQAVLAVVSLVFLINTVELDKVIGSLTKLNWTLFSFAVLLLPVNLMLEAKKWHLLIRKVSKKTSYIDALGSMLAGFSLGIFTPARIGDYAGRALYLDHRNKWELVALTFTDRMISLSSYILFGLTGLTIFLQMNPNIPGYLSYIVFYASAVLFLLIAYCLINPGSIYRSVVTTFKLTRLRSVISFLSKLSHADVVKLFSVAVLRYIVFSTQFVLLIYSFGDEKNLLAMYLATSLIFLTKSIIPSFTLLELGIREGAAIYFFGAFGVASAIAFDSALLLFTINILIPALIGIPFIFRLKDWNSSQQ